ncbi:Uncharacterised protein [Capnocytophaga ochracea]|uniref:Uncharacterized protein n=1 Tax=Capnocytophaga ochracea TaxID=1018 RepID=A0A2X2RC50_CAPOC|nr:Uncharacterised protein [Capnocytophaga ochracea]
MKCKGRKKFFNTKNADNGNNSNLTLAKFKTLPKFEMKKRCIGVVRRRRKISEENGRVLRGILIKKGYEEGGVSL